MRKSGLACVALALALTACAGGSSNVGIPPTAQVPNAPTGASFTFTLPAKNTSSSQQRRPAYISPSTQSVAITLNGATPPIVANLTAGSNACPSATPPIRCTIFVPAPLGADTFLMTFYDTIQTPGAPLAGHPLSTTSVTATIVANVANTINLTFNGIPATLSVSLSNSAPATGAASVVTLSANALDADGNIIVGPGSYVDAAGTPLTLTLSDNDASGATGLFIPSGSTCPTTAPTSLATSLTLTAPTLFCAAYSGSGSLTSAMFSLSAGGLTTASTTLTPLYPGSSAPPLSIYVANGPGVLVFAPTASGNSTPIFTSSQTFHNVKGIAVDGADFTYALDPTSSWDVITLDGNLTGNGLLPGGGGIFPPTSMASDTVAGVAVAQNGYVYVADSTSLSVLVFPQNYSSNKLPPLQTISLSSFLPAGSSLSALAVDPTTGNIAVLANGTTAGFPAPTVLVIPGGTTTPSRSFTVPVSGDPYGWLNGIALDPTGNVYVAVADSQGVTPPGIYVYSASVTSGSNVVPTTKISNANMLVPNGVGLDQNGNVYVADSSQSPAVWVFAPSGGSYTLSRTITSSSFSAPPIPPNSPVGIAVASPIAVNPPWMGLCYFAGSCGSAPTSAPVTVSEPGYAGVFHAILSPDSSGCASSLAISPASQTASSPGAAVSFTISERSPTGVPCAFEITDSAGHWATAYATGN